MRQFFLTTFLSLAIASAPVAFAAEPMSKPSSPVLPKEVLVNGIELVLIPEGWFWYSVENGDVTQLADNKKRFRTVKIWLDSFYIAKYEARARDFQRFMNATKTVNTKSYEVGNGEGCSVRLNENNDYFIVDGAKDLPATHLSWQLSADFARWLGMRLPNEAEWEKAARGTDKRIWPWGNQYPDDTLANFSGGSACQHIEVGSNPAGQSPYGVFNMAGNVFEYVADWYNANRDLTLQDGMKNPPLATEGTLRTDMRVPNIIAKGGRWASEAVSTSIAHREFSPPGYPFICYGARFAMDVSGVQKALAENKASIITP